MKTSVGGLTKVVDYDYNILVDYKVEVPMLNEERLNRLLEEPLDSIMTIRIGVSARTALREIAQYFKTTEQDIIRRFAAILATAYQDAKEQAGLGASYDELLSRTTKFTLTKLVNTPPADLRRMAEEFSKAAYALADLMERGSSRF